MAPVIAKSSAKKAPAAPTKGQRSLHTFFTKQPSNGQISSLPATDTLPIDLSKKFVQRAPLNASHLLTPAPSSDAIEYLNAEDEDEELIAWSSKRDESKSNGLSTPPALTDTVGLSGAPSLTSSPPTRVRVQVGPPCLFKLIEILGKKACHLCRVFTY